MSKRITSALVGHRVSWVDTEGGETTAKVVEVRPGSKMPRMVVELKDGGTQWLRIPLTVTLHDATNGELYTAGEK